MSGPYAVGDWESVWACEPYLTHRLVLDLASQHVIAGQDRYRRRRSPMSVDDCVYLKQILDETFDDIWESPAEYGFKIVHEIPPWALEAWLWPRPLTGEDDEGDDQSFNEPVGIDEHGCRFPPPPEK